MNVIVLSAAKFKKYEVEIKELKHFCGEQGGKVKPGHLNTVILSICI